MKLFDNRLLLGCLAWLPMVAILGFLYFFIDFPGSVPLYVTVSLWTVTIATSSFTGLLIALQIFEASSRTFLSLTGGLISGSIAWVILSKIADATLANLIG